MLTGLKVSSLACKRIFYKSENAKGRPWNWILKVFKCKNEIYKQIELQEYIKNGIMFTPGVIVIKI